MKKLPMPTVNDLVVLDKMKYYLNSPTGLLVQAEYPNILQKYKDYDANKGNPFKCVGGTISSSLIERLEYHYKYPRGDLQYIGKIRNYFSPDVCPLCGSSKTGTLDHFLPQINYPEWILFSRNLVPACDCNSKRQNKVNGERPNQRILHPYYDECLKYRLVIAKISPPFDNPEISIVPVGRSVVHNDTVQFHIDTVINKSTAISWMKNKWQTLVRKPRLIITAIPRDNRVISMPDLEKYLRETLSDKDEELLTSNNWYSMLLAGVLSSREARAWLLSRHNAIVSGLIDGF